MFPTVLCLAVFLLEEGMLAWFFRVLKDFELFKCRPIDFFFFTASAMIEAQRFGTKQNSLISFLVVRGDALLNQNTSL